MVASWARCASWGELKLIGRSVQFNCAAVLMLHSGENLDQRALAGTVLANQCMHFTGFQINRRVGECDDTGEGLSYPRHSQEAIIAIGHRLG